MSATREKRTATVSISVDVKPAGGQDARLVEVLRVGDHVLRVDVRVDSYVVQSHARVERWNGERWHLVHSLTPQTMSAKGGGYAPASGKREFFAADRERLLAVARQILGVDRVSALDAAKAGAR